MLNIIGSRYKLVVDTNSCLPLFFMCSNMVRPLRILCLLHSFDLFLVNDQHDTQIPFHVFIFLFITLYMFRAHCAHHQERQIVSIQPLVTVTLCRWPCRVQVHMTQPPTQSDSYQILIQFVSPDDEHDVFETCREL